MLVSKEACGHVASASAWQTTSYVEVSFWEAVDDHFLRADCSSFWIPPPPVLASRVWQVARATLKLHARQKKWFWRLLETIRMATAAAYKGKPQWLQLAGMGQDSIGQIGAWLLDCGAVLNPPRLGGSEMFHLEFVLQ